MKLPSSRVSLRLLMVAVTIIALALGTSEWIKRRAVRFSLDSEKHLEMAFYYGEIHESFIFMDHKESPKSLLAKDKGNYHAQLFQKYERASRYPWLPVAPDPLEPK